MLRRLVLSTSAVALLGSAAFAGGAVYPDPEPVVIVEQGSSSNPALLVPLLLLVLIAAAAASSDNDGEEENGGGGGSHAGGGATASDRRIKTDVTWVGMARGLPVYRFRYIGSPAQFEGVMAQDVLGHTPDAVVVRSNGLMAVDYAKLGMTMKLVA